MLTALSSNCWHVSPMGSANILAPSSATTNALDAGMVLTAIASVFFVGFWCPTHVQGSRGLAEMVLLAQVG